MSACVNIVTQIECKWCLKSWWSTCANDQGERRERIEYRRKKIRRNVMVWRLSITSFKPNVTKYIECLVIVCNQSKISSIDQSDQIAWSTSGTCTFPCVQRISTQSKWIDFNLVTRSIFLNWSKYCHLFNWTKKKHCNTVKNDDFWIWIWIQITMISVIVVKSISILRA